MADYVIPPKEVIVRCRCCKALYVPDLNMSYVFHGAFRHFEKCPVCNFEKNDEEDTIPLWKYNLIKLVRGGFRNE